MSHTGESSKRKSINIDSNQCLRSTCYKLNTNFKPGYTHVLNIRAYKYKYLYKYIYAYNNPHIDITQVYIYVYIYMHMYQ